MAKPCPVTRKEFREKAQPVEMTIAGQRVLADRKEFSTGSMGWYYTGKLNLEVGGKLVQVQIGVNMTAIGSKNLPKDD